MEAKGKRNVRGGECAQEIGWLDWTEPVLILTDHKSLEDWVHEKRDTPSAPEGRRARWHETLSKFELQVQYLPRKENVAAIPCPDLRTPHARRSRTLGSMGMRQRVKKCGNFLPKKEKEDAQ